MQGPVRTVEVTGVLDEEAARRVYCALSALGPDECAVVDLHEVRTYEVCALASVAAEVARAAGRASLRGLDRRQWRFLGYLGLGGAILAAQGEGHEHQG
jgi:hypothetical protein